MQDDNEEAKVIDWWKDSEVKSYFAIIEKRGKFFLVESKTEG